MEIRKELEKKFNKEDIKWRVQACGFSNGKKWVRFNPYLDVLTIQERLNNIFSWDGWQSKEYINEDHSVTVELKIWSEKREEWITRAGTADIVDKGNKTQDENSIKSAATSAFKRAAASFGIGSYLKEFKEVWGEECSKDTPDAIKCENKKDNLVFYAIPKVPKGMFPLEGNKKDIPSPLVEEKIKSISFGNNFITKKQLDESLLFLKNNLELDKKELAARSKDILEYYKIDKLSKLTINQLKFIDSCEWEINTIKARKEVA